MSIEALLHVENSRMQVLLDEIEAILGELESPLEIYCSNPLLLDCSCDFLKFLLQISNFYLEKFGNPRSFCFDRGFFTLGDSSTTTPLKAGNWSTTVEEFNSASLSLE